MRNPWLVLILTACAAFGQETLKPGQPAARDLEASASHLYSVTCSAGDYVEGAILQAAKTDLTISYPDGTLLRRYAGTETPGSREFAFVAEKAGTYQIKVTSLGTGPAKYTLTLARVLSVDEQLKREPEKPKYSSPRIEALRKQLESGASSAEFWAKVAKEGTPMAEAIEKDDKNQFVTFLWRGNSVTRHVLVLGSFKSEGDPLNNVLRRLGESDVWYWTTRLPKAARFTYSLSPNDPLTFERPRTSQRNATRQADPLNPTRWGCPPEASRFACQSLAELPGAVPQPWIAKRPNVPTGAIEKNKIKSELLKNERNLSIYTPPGYKKDGAPYALLLVFDESAYLDRVPTPVTLDNLIAAGEIPPTVAVLIANPSQEARSKELPPNPDFADFLAKELIPWVRGNYNVTRDPRLTVVAGSSYGGIASTYAGLRHPGIFGNILCQSGSFWWAPDHTPSGSADTETGWLAKEFLKVPKLPLRFYMDAGIFEVDTNGSGGAILEPSRHMRDVLLAKGYEVRYQQFVGGHDYASWRGTLADGLLFLLGKR